MWSLEMITEINKPGSKLLRKARKSNLPKGAKLQSRNVNDKRRGRKDA